VRGKIASDIRNMASTIQNAGRLFRVATAATDSVTAADRDGHQQAALVSLVFAVIAVEAFFNEAVGLAELCIKSERAFIADGVIPKSPEPPVVALFAQEMSKKESKSLLSKAHIAQRLLTGQRAGRKAQPFRDLGILVEVRNTLVHFEPNEIYTKPEVTREMLSHIRNPAIKLLQSKGVLAENIEGLANWTAHIETKALARWSCDVATRVVVDFISKTPTAGQWGHMLWFTQGSFTGEAPRFRPEPTRG
jgi:hypothetical protein